MPAGRTSACRRPGTSCGRAAPDRACARRSSGPWRRIGAAFERVTTIRCAADVGMVPGGDGVEAEQVGALGKAGELDRPIAFDTRIRCHPAGVRVDVRRDDVLVEVVAEVEHQVIDAELLRDAAGVVDVGHRAAAGVTVAAPQLHRDADDLVTGALQQQRGNRRVDTTGHRAHHLHDALRPAPAVLRRRSWSTETPMTSIARSTSAAVVVWPSVSRSAPSALDRSTPIAASTCDGSMAPLAHAEAADAHTSASSSRKSSASDSIPATHT